MAGMSNVDLWTEERDLLAEVISLREQFLQGRERFCLEDLLKERDTLRELLGLVEEIAARGPAVVGSVRSVVDSVQQLASVDAGKLRDTAESLRRLDLPRSRQN
jgi:hypothetical protein